MDPAGRLGRPGQAGDPADHLLHQAGVGAGQHPGAGGPAQVRQQPLARVPAGPVARAADQRDRAGRPAPAITGPGTVASAATVTVSPERSPSGRVAMNPGHGLPNRGAPAACSTARSRPNARPRARRGLLRQPGHSQRGGIPAEHLRQRDRVRVGQPAQPARFSLEDPAQVGSGRLGEHQPAVGQRHLVVAPLMLRPAGRTRAPRVPVIRASRSASPDPARAAGLTVHPGAGEGRRPAGVPSGPPGRLRPLEGPAELPGQAAHGALHQVEGDRVVLGGRRTGRGPGLERSWRPSAPGRSERSSRSRGLAASARRHLPQSARLARSMASTRSGRRTRTARTAGPGARTRRSRAGPARPGPAVHRAAHVPVPGARAVHLDPVGQPGRSSSARSTTSAIGDRQMLPRQTKQTR